MTRRNATSPLDAMRRSGQTRPPVPPPGGPRSTTPPVVRLLREAAAGGWARLRSAVEGLKRDAGEPGGTPAAAPSSARAGGGGPLPSFKGAWTGVLNAAGARSGEFWWVGSGEVITLRLPRGVTVLAVGGVVGVIALAFVAGRRTGAPASVAAATPTEAAPAVVSEGALAGLDAEDVPGGGAWPGSTPADAPAADPAQRLQARFDAGLDPRVDGLNYLVYLTATRRECVRLRDFLAERGVDVIVMESSRSVRAGSGADAVRIPLYWVVDVSEGFSRAAYLRGEHEGFKARRMELGRAWKRHNGGRGSDLSDMQFYAYRRSS